jgi:CTP synthase (UTP-ammonia lyase)
MAERAARWHQPDAIVARTELPLPASVKQKIALFCDVPRDNVIEDPDLPSSYHAPIRLHENGLTRCIALGLGLEPKEPDLSEWTRRVRLMTTATDRARIAVVGKYVELKDSYISIRESLTHAAIAENINLSVDWISSESITARRRRLLRVDEPCRRPEIAASTRSSRRFAREARFLLGCARHECMDGIKRLAPREFSEFDLDSPDR